MGELVVHPKDKEQLTVLQAFMNALNISFEYKDDSNLPRHILDSINKGLEEAKKGETISFDEFKNKHYKH